MPEIAYVNGEFVPLARAMVHVEDRGFQFADGVYEVVRTYGGRPFAVDEHVARLMRSLAAVEIEHSLTADQIKLLIAEAARRADFPEAIVYLQITRGTSPRHRGFPSRPNPTLVMTVRELHPPKSLATGIRVITTADLRWARCDIKSVALLANVLAYAAAQKAGANDAIFVEADGTVTEATAGNVFVIGNRRLRTPPKGPKILSGVTREKILQAAPAAELECREERIGREELYGADEIFLSSTTAEVLPVVAVDGRQIGMGRPGKISEQIYEQFLKKFVGATASAR